MEPGLNQTKVGKNKMSHSKVDPSFKSKRYRDKLRTEVKALESLLPVDKPTLHRKLDSQTVYRLAIAFLRIKSYFKAVDLTKTKEIQIVNNSDEKSGVESDHEDETGDKCKETFQGVPISSPPDVESFTDADFFQPSILKQVLDGFILVASVDGTVMYVSENILQFNGFNQVDLKHRCLYSVIHPDDQRDVRDILEHNGAYTYNDPQSMPKPARKKYKPKTNVEESVPMSFFCRMKCFSGNAAGYLKLHCTGKIQTVPTLTRTPKTSDSVVLLYCKPFLLHGNDILHEAKQRIFWSKHDLDLRIKDIEKQSTDITGYEDNEICDKSLYQFVHPEDLCVLVHVHKSITEINEVQSFYFRFQHKDGSWTWLHSKGKVICKNSKKFSIVFTHCPVRDEDCVFIQQEAMFRRRYGLDDLIDMNKSSSTPYAKCKEDHDTAVHTTKLHCMEDIHRNRPGDSAIPVKQTFIGSCINEELTAITNPLNFMGGNCPSTWHTDSERHSPVVPSSHMAHKISIREKQIHLAELKRKQHMSSQVNTSLNYHGNGYPVQNGIQPYWNSYNNPCKLENGTLTDSHPANHHGSSSFSFRPYMIDFSNMQSFQSQYNDDRYNASVNGSYVPNRQFYYVNCIQSEPYNYPPSPPPSPRMHNGQISSPHQLAYNDNHCVFRGMIQSSNNAVTGSRCNFEMQSPVNVDYSRSGNPKGISNSYQLNSLMTCSGVSNNVFPFENAQTPSFFGTSARHLTSQNHAANHMKEESEISQSCARLNNDCISTAPRERVSYDIDSSIHMKIVEIEAAADNEKTEVVPVIESFMDYLNNSNS